MDSTPNSGTQYNMQLLKACPPSLREAYLRVAPHPEQSPAFHDKCVTGMLEFKDCPLTRSIDQGAHNVMMGDSDIVRPWSMPWRCCACSCIPRSRYSRAPTITLVQRADWHGARAIDAPVGTERLCHPCRQGRPAPPWHLSYGMRTPNGQDMWGEICISRACSARASGLYRFLFR